jgi:carbon starvation protein
MSAMYVMIFVLCAMAIAYRYYSAFLAARVAALNDANLTPAVRLNDGQNYHPTNKWVLFGHHFAAISGAGPLIGPVLAAQFGYLPGLLWIVIGVCLGGAVQDFLVLGASLRRNGRSLAQIAFSDIGPIAGTAATVAILFIIVIALAGLGKVVVKALGGEEVKYPAGSILILQAAPLEASAVDAERSVLLGIGSISEPERSVDGVYTIPPRGLLRWGAPPDALRRGGGRSMTLSDEFQLRTKTPLEWQDEYFSVPGSKSTSHVGAISAQLPPDAVRLVAGSSWGTFTIACTIPIALFVGLWMYKIRPGKVVEASLIGGAMTLVATVVGGYVANSSIGPFFALKDTTVVWSMAAYGFIASVLPVWILLCPRDYLSSFLKIGTIAILVVGVIVANPKLEAPPVQHAFLGGGPTVPGKIFPFLFITIMCGAISGFHALVSSGTTPKMIKRETDARTIGYGAMLIEGLVGVCAMIAAATLPVGDYYAMNTDLGKVPAFHDRFTQIGADVDHLNVYETRTQESLRGRTGGAVTLAVGMAHIFDGIPRRLHIGTENTLGAMWKYWYHFAIMFEALFILTTIDTGTRIGRFLLQEVMGKTIGEPWGRTDWWPGAILSTLVIVAGWAYFINANSMAVIWPMFGVANQMLAVIALAVVSAYLVNVGRARYLWVTVVPMCVVMTTTSSAAVTMFMNYFTGFTTQLHNTGAARNYKEMFNSAVTGGLIAAMLICTVIIILAAARRIWNRTDGFRNLTASVEPEPIAVAK